MLTKLLFLLGHIVAEKEEKVANEAENGNQMTEEKKTVEGDV